MVNRVMIISASSRAALQPLSKQVPRANSRQRQAIAAGMALAANVCGGKSGDHVRTIERVARDITDPTFQREFRTRSDGLRFSTDYRSRERAIAEALNGLPRPEEGGRSTLFNSNALGLIHPLGAIAPIPSTIQPIR